MTETLRHVDHPPQWASDFASEIDTLQFGPGFARLTEKTRFSFGVTKMVGRKAVEEFFEQIDGKLDTAHRILDFWQGQTYHILRGEADLAKKDSSDSTVVDPFMWIFYMDHDDPETFERVFIVNGPVQTESIL